VKGGSGVCKEIERYIVYDFQHPKKGQSDKEQCMNFLKLDLIRGDMCFKGRSDPFQGSVGGLNLASFW